MNQPTLHKEDIENGLSASAVSTTRIIQLALVAGVVMYAGVIILLLATRQGPAEVPQPSETDLTGILLMALAATAPVCLGMAAFVDRLILKPSALTQRLAGLRQEDGTLKSGAIDSLAAFHRTLLILRLAFLEGLAFFGLMIVIMSVTSGRIEHEPIVWLGMIPAAIMVIFGVATFPSRRSIVDFLDQRVVRVAQRHQGSGF